MNIMTEADAWAVEVGTDVLPSQGVKEKGYCEAEKKGY